LNFYPYYHYSFIFNTTTLEQFYHINDDLLVKHLLGEATPGEQAEVNRWLEEDPANLAYYHQLEKIWVTSRELAVVSTVDENKAWKNFQQRIHGNESNPTTTPARVSFLRPWMRIAAAILLLIGLGWIAFNFFTTKDAKQELVASAETIVIDTLPDGSVVTLNKQSAITYPAKFKGRSRPVVLKGEAFFNVTPDKSKPFIISVDDVEVKVVGTSFNIKSQDGITEVVVETGIVQVTRNGATTELKAGETLVLGAKQDMEKGKAAKDLYYYYRPREFYCDNTPLWKLVEEMNQAYDTTVVIGNPSLRNIHITSPYINKSVKEIIENVIELEKNTQAITYEMKGDTIILK
jgi:transmembrane sensor